MITVSDSYRSKCLNLLPPRMPQQSGLHAEMDRTMSQQGVGDCEKVRPVAAGRKLEHFLWKSVRVVTDGCLMAQRYWGAYRLSL